jgi:hypothetical protein
MSASSLIQQNWITGSHSFTAMTDVDYLDVEAEFLLSASVSLPQFHPRVTRNFRLLRVTGEALPYAQREAERQT